MKRTNAVMVRLDDDQSAELNRLAARVTVACLDLHRELGPGAPRRLYEEALVFELDCAGIASRRRVSRCRQARRWKSITRSRPPCSR